jgi:DNA-directed RNA polymerase specialized sigma24 family protein
VTGRHHVADVYRYALAMSGDSGDALDITHTTLAEAYWVGQGRPAPQSQRKRLIDIAHDICRRRFDKGIEGEAPETTCPDAELALTRRVDGRLPRREGQALQAHLRVCPECPALADDLQAQRRALRALGGIAVPESLS